jgi:hypothetical protein
MNSIVSVATTGTEPQDSGLVPSLKWFLIQIFEGEESESPGLFLNLDNPGSPIEFSDTNVISYIPRGLFSKSEVRSFPEPTEQVIEEYLKTMPVH